MSNQLQDSVFMPSASQLRNGGTLEDIFKCFICLGKVVDAKLCPCCSKLCCNSCITRWLTEQRPQCPHCRSPLRASNLVNCRFVAEISQALENLQVARNENEEQCSLHSNPINYFCVTCDTPICSDCAMFGTEHKDHEFKHLSKIYEKHVEQINKEALGLRKKLKELTLILHEIDGNIEKVKGSKETKSKDLVFYMEQMQARLEAQLQNKMQTLHERKSTVCQEIEKLENLHVELNKKLSRSGKSSLISQTPEILNTLKDVHKKPISKFKKSYVSAEFPSEIVPCYDCAVFEIKNYSQLRESVEVVYSEPLHVYALTWRLKVYPNGNGVARGTYLSVFLELLKGPQDTSKYEYRVEMVNHRNPNLCVVREFASEFDPGECWGYNRFFRIDLLSEEGYLDENDRIVLRYYVRAPTYYKQCQDQKKYIDYLEKSREAAFKEAEELKAKLGEQLEESKSVMSSNENPLEKIDKEETKENLNYIEEDSEKLEIQSESSFESDEEDNLRSQLKRISELQIEERKQRSEEILKEESAGSVHELNTVFQRYMLSPEHVSSVSSSPQQLKWEEESDYAQQDWELSVEQLSPSEPLSENLLMALDAVQKACLQ